MFSVNEPSAFFSEGKKPETIQEIWKDAFTEARWHQPSVLVFDDLDLLIANPDPVQDPGATILYHSRLAEGEFSTFHVFRGRP